VEVSRRDALVRRIRWLAAATTCYNLVEGVVAIAAGSAASSSALIGFGLDSLIEASSAAPRPTDRGWVVGATHG
jgi:hypothetical protein